MQGNVKILYGGKDVFAGICPTPFLYFDKEYIEYGSNWGSKYNFSIEGQITGKLGPNSFYDLENKKNELILNFKKDNLPIKVTEDSSEIFLSDICSIDSISFDQSKYYALLPFSIKASCYDSGTFGENYGVLEPQDSWDYSESEDGMVSLRHSVSAAGFNSSGVSAIANVKKWAATKTGIGKKIDSLKIKNLSATDFILESFSEQVDRFNGKYAIEEVYRGDLLSSNSAGVGILRYTADISKNIDDGITKVVVDGSAAGKNNVGEADMTLLRAKINAEDFFQYAADCANKSTGSNKLNSTPFSRTITENKENCEITFSLSYDDNPVPPGQAKCVYKVDLSENLIKNIVDVKLDAEILCDRGDASIRWTAVKNYYETKFDGYDIALKEYKRAGYTKAFNSTPRTESINYDEFNSKITYSADWSDRYMPYSDILTSISEQVEVTPSLKTYTVQPSLYSNAVHNVQDFGCASRASVSISIGATAKPDKTIQQLKNCVFAELSRLSGIYVKTTNMVIDQKTETVNEKYKKMSISYSYSFDGTIVT
jgi:hypothetical protein